MCSLRSFRIVALIVLLFGALSFQFSSLYAAGVVNPCDEASLDAALAGGGIVTFACSGTITVTTPKIFAIDTTIDGVGQTVTISGGGLVRVFETNAGVTLTLSNLTVTNSTAPDQGGAVLNNGNVNTTNVTFIGNTVTGAGGGGAIINYGTANITNSIFTGNSAPGAPGGAIYNVAGTVIIGGSSFNNNTARDAGAIMNLVTLMVNNTTFTGNSNVGGPDGGGAVYNNGGTATFVNGSFTNNTSNNQGGAIMNGGGFGNAILNLTNVNFSGNSATVMGGAIMNGCILTTCIGGIMGTTTINGGTFSGNNSPDGGAIANNVGTVDVNGATISGNTGAVGAAISTTATTTSTNTAYVNNACTTGITDNGGNTVNSAPNCPGVIAITGTIQFNPNTPLNVQENAGVVNVPVELVVTGGTLVGPVTVNVAYTGGATGGGTDYTGTPLTLNFGSNLTPGTYSQNITLTIVDDPAGEPSEDVILTLNTPSGATFGANTTRTVNIGDNDSPGASVVQSGGSTDVAELGVTADTYTIALNTAPAANVIVTFTPDAQCSAVVSPLTFTNADWNVPQTVTVNAVDDAAPEASPHPCFITHTFAGDATYAVLPTFTVTVNVYDNDAPGAGVTTPLLPPPPPALNCQELNDPAFTIPPGLYCYVLMRNGAWTRIMGTVPEGVVQLGVVIAVDVMYYDYPGHAAPNFPNDQYQRICLLGSGRFLYADLRNMPRTYTELATEAQGSYVCAWVAAPGTVVLVEN